MPLRFLLSGGQASDIAYAQPLLDKACIPGLRGRPRKRCRWLLADKGYDAEALRRYCDRYRMQPVIPLRSMRRKPKPGLLRLFDRPKYRQRNIIEHDRVAEGEPPNRYALRQARERFCRNGLVGLCHAVHTAILFVQSLVAKLRSKDEVNLAGLTRQSIFRPSRIATSHLFILELLENTLKKLFVASTCAALLSGCVGDFASPPKWPWETSPCSGACNDEAANKAYSDAMAYCSKTQEYFYNGGKYIAGGRFVTAAVGTLAGAVLAPITSGAASTAWSGISGSSNALQASMDSNFTQAAAVRRRASVAEAGKIGILAYSAATTPGSRVTIAVSMAFNCSVAGASADASSLQAIAAAPFNPITPAWLPSIPVTVPSGAPGGPTPTAE